MIAKAAPEEVTLVVAAALAVEVSCGRGKLVRQSNAKAAALLP